MHLPGISGFSAPATFLMAYVVYELGLKRANPDWYMASVNKS